MMAKDDLGSNTLDGSWLVKWSELGLGRWRSTAVE